MFYVPFYGRSRGCSVFPARAVIISGCAAPRIAAARTLLSQEPTHDTRHNHRNNAPRAESRENISSDCAARPTEEKWVTLYPTQPFLPLRSRETSQTASSVSGRARSGTGYLDLLGNRSADSLNTRVDGDFLCRSLKDWCWYTVSFLVHCIVLGGLDCVVVLVIFDYEGEIVAVRLLVTEGFGLWESKLYC